MGGDIVVTSTNGAGSTFTIDIPLVRAVAPVVELAPERSEIVSLAQAQLLLVEANPLNQGIMRAMIGPKVRVLHVAGDLDEAFKLVAGGSIDHVLADGGALDLDVATAGRMIDAASVQRARVTILWPAPDADLVQNLEARGAQVVAKPIMPSELLNALEMTYRLETASHDIAA